MLSDAGFQLGGMRLTISSDLPLGAGLSSSAALEVATAMAAKSLFQLEIEKMQLAQLCQKRGKPVCWGAVRVIGSGILRLWKESPADPFRFSQGHRRERFAAVKRLLASVKFWSSARTHRRRI